MNLLRLCVGIAIICGTPLEAFADEDPGPSVVPYGFVRLDAIYDDSKMSHPQFPFWVVSEPDGFENDAEFDLNPRLTRVGLKLTPQKIGRGFTGTAKVEIDFQAGGSESRALIRMRHAYMALSSGSFEIAAGQQSDLISPLYPAANNDGVMWNAGNTGDRRSQLRLSATPAIGQGSARFAIAAGMPNAVNKQDADGNGQLDGLDAAVPTLQVLAELRLPQLTTGVWGHAASDKVADDNVASLLAGGHLKVTLGKFWLQGEVFIGDNASDLRAGIGQGINADGEGIGTIGGWAELGVQATDIYKVMLGATIDRTKVGDLDDGMRQKNQVVYLVQRVAPLDNLSVGFEYQFWKTTYRRLDSGQAHRVNIHAAYSF